jgi:O-antigen ligase
MMSRSLTLSGLPEPGTYRALTRVALALAALMAGAGVPLYVGAIGDGLGKAAALPAFLLLCLVLLYSRSLLFLAIIVLRASADIVFDASKLSVAGQQIGVGALVNAFVLGIALLLVLEKPGRLPGWRIAAIWGAFLLAALYGVAASPMKVDALRSYLALLSNLAVFAAAFHFVRSPADFRNCLRIVVWSSAIPCLYAFVEIASGGAQRADAFRIQSTFTHPNIFGCYLTLNIALLLYLIHGGGQRQRLSTRLVLHGHLGLMALLLLLTQARGAWIACALVVVVHGVLFERRYLLFVAVLPFLALLVPGVQDRVLDLAAGNDTASQYARLNSFAWRRLMWESGLGWMRPDHYLLGYGAGSFRFFSPDFFPLAGNFNPGAHSVVVQLLFEIGALGLAAFLWLFARLLWTLRLAWRVDARAAAIVGTLVVAYLVMCLSDNMLEYLSFNWYFWFVCGAACALGLAPREGGGARRRAPADA